MTITDAREEGLDEIGGRWLAVCEHGSMAAHETKAEAKVSAKTPGDFCEECRDNVLVIEDETQDGRRRIVCEPMEDEYEPGIGLPYHDTHAEKNGER